MKQQTFTDIEYANRKRTTKREKFLDMMDGIIPWDEWVRTVEPHYYKDYKGKPGRKPVGVETMLRMYLLQVWFSLSDEATEDSVCDSYAMRKFVGAEFNEGKAPDATTLLKFRHRIEEAGLGKVIFDALNAFLADNGYMMKGGTVMDATLIAAPPSTKNAKGERDPEMHSAKKGNQWHFGMKCHIGVDAGTGLIHSVTATAANVSDIEQAADLLRDDDEVAYGDSGYVGIEKRPEIVGDEKKRGIAFRINAKRGTIRALSPAARAWAMDMEKRKSATRCKVEHAFHIIKRTFGFVKVCCRGIEKNLNRCYMSALSANLLMLARAGRELKPLGS
jgi:IS5 family transposase